MKKYNQYYDVFKESCWEILEKKEKKFGGNFWKNDGSGTINDMPIIENKTDVKNSEWVILHQMITQLLIDYINEHPADNEVFSYSIDIDFQKGEWKTYLKDVKAVPIDLPQSDIEYTYDSYAGVNDYTVIDSYDGLNQVIYFYLSDFIRKHSNSIKYDVTRFLFSINNLNDSLLAGKLLNTSETSFSIYCGGALIVCDM